MSVVTTTIKCDGSAIPATYALVAVDVRRALNRLPSAVLLFQDGDIAEQRFAVSDAGTFALGKEVEILARFEGDPSRAGRDAVLFKGLVVRHGVEAGPQGSVLRVDLRDKAIKLTRPRRNKVSRDMTDSDAIAAVVKAAGLSAQVDATRITHASLVQYDCSDWDWLVARAQAAGLLVTVQDGKVIARKLPAAGDAVLRLNFGVDDILDLQFECDATGQDNGFDAVSWDIDGQKPSRVSGTPAPAPAMGNLGGAAAARALGFGEATLWNATALLPDEAAAWAAAEAQRTQMALLRGRVRTIGQGALQLLDVIDLRGVPRAFTGKAPITGLCHRIDAQGWTTDLQFGLDDAPHNRRADIARAPAGGLVPPVGGLQIGVVVAVGDDPDGQHRVKLTLAGLGDDAPHLWARMASIDAGKDRGVCFWPEPGDEVVLGFFNDDPRQPVVLGSLYSSKHPPPKAVADDSSKNTLRGLVTRGGLTIGLVDADKPRLFLETPGGAKLLMDDEAQSIVISDQHNNTITLDKNGITIASGKDLTFDANGGGGKVSIKGQTIDLN